MITDKFEKVEINKLELQKYIEDYFLDFSLLPSSKQMHTFALKDFYVFFTTRRKFYFLPENIEAYIDYLTYRLELKPYTIRNYLTAVKRFFKYLIKVNVLQKNPASRITYKITEYPPQKAVINSEQINFISNSTFDKNNYLNARNLILLKLALLSKLKKADILRLQTNDLSKILINERNNDNKLYEMLLKFANIYNLNYLFTSRSPRTNGNILSERMNDDIVILELKKLNPNLTLSAISKDNPNY